MLPVSRVMWALGLRWWIWDLVSVRPVRLISIRVRRVQPARMKARATAWPIPGGDERDVVGWGALG